MQTMGNSGEACPFAFNFDPATFKPGDVVSYRVPEPMGDFPFIGTILAVYDDYIELSHGEPASSGLAPAAGQVKIMRGTRESRPVVSEADAM